MHSGLGFVVHTPLAQACPVEHTVPHPPQLFGSVFSLTHTPSHEVSPSPQTVVQVPDVQTCPVEHTTPHPPQLFTSLAKFVQVEGSEPPKQQLLSPTGQTASLWLLTCAATAGAPTVMTCTLAGLPGGK